MFTKSLTLLVRKSVILGPVTDCSIHRLRVQAEEPIKIKFWSIKKEFLSLPPSSSPITEKQLMKLCQLAKLDYEQISQKNPSLKQDIQSIMQLLEKIQTISTIPEQTEPMYSILQYYYNAQNVEDNYSQLRPDIVVQENGSKEILQNATEKKGQFFSVPKMKGQKDVL